MEPIAVLGLVANIVQLVDAAGKAFTICSEIYTLGETIEDSRMTFTSKQLLDACNDLNRSFNPNSSPTTPTRSGNNLNLLATQCSQTAQDLQAELDSLRTPPGSGVRSTLRKAWLKKKKSKEIDKLKLALDKLEKTLNSVVLIDVWQALDALDMKQEGQSKLLEQNLSRVLSNLQSCQSSLATSLNSEIRNCIQASEAQHMVTRENVNTHTTRAMQDLSLSQKAQLDEQKQQQRLQQQYDQISNSLRFNEMNTRMNDIAESHAETFHWIFEEDATGPWDNFSEWLKAGSHVYWINGKAGSGKSTLMRFLIDDPRTRDLLAQWSPSQQPLIVKFYFWLSGTEMQRSLKGLLCSILHQLFHEDESLLEKLLQDDPGLLSKRNPGDWSKKELRLVLMRSIDLLDCPLCVFLDGLDEYNQDNDMDQLLDLVDKISMQGITKLCVSSRLEHYLEKRMSRYKQLRLQDLTADDMDICIRTALEETRNRCRPASIDNLGLAEIVNIIAQKADGVFLWVHYALSSLVTGMRKEDTFRDLLRRIEQLPSGIHKLYLEMWGRLNEDKQLYQVEAATYFSYAADISERRSISLFDLLVALNPQLQKTIVDDLTPQDPLRLSHDCELLKTRVLTRSAGLLDFSMVLDLKYKDDQDLHNSAVDGNVTSIAGTESNEGDSLRMGNSHGYSNLIYYYSSKLKYLHRTARDFLLGTEDGQKLCRKPQDLPFKRFKNTLRARTAALMQGLANLEYDTITRMMSNIKYQAAWYAEGEEYETEFVVDIRRVCQILSVPGVYERHIGYGNFWEGQFANFECAAAFYGFTEYIQKYIQARHLSINPHCRGLLVLYAARGAIYAKRPMTGAIALVSWLASKGADLHIADIDESHPSYGTHIPWNPASTVLDLFSLLSTSEDETRLARIYDTFCTIPSYLVSQSSDNVIKLSPNDDFHWSLVRGKVVDWVEPGDVLLQISISKLCYLVMRRIEQRISGRPKRTRPAIGTQTPIRVILLRQDDNDPVCPSEEDSLYLGEPLDTILFQDDIPDAAKQTLADDFDARVNEVSERSPKKDPGEWTQQYTAMLKQEGRLADASAMSPEALGDKWFV